MRKWMMWVLIIGIGVYSGWRWRKGQTVHEGYFPKPVETGLVLVAAGDIACDERWEVKESECQQQATAEIIDRIKPDVALVLGDLYYTAAKTDSLRGYDESWGKFKSITFPVAGNHEYSQSEGAAGYWNYWGERAGVEERGWYSWDQGGWHLVALNSNCAEVGCGVNSEQVGWLREDLQANKQNCTLVFMHHPRFSSGVQHGDDLELRVVWETLKNGNVDVVLAGHEHNYERLEVEGIKEFVVGTGGRSLYEFGAAKVESEKRVANEFGVLKLSLGKGVYDWEFINIEERVLDRGSGECTTGS